MNSSGRGNPEGSEEDFKNFIKGVIGGAIDQYGANESAETLAEAVESEVEQIMRERKDEIRSLIRERKNSETVDAQESTPATPFVRPPARRAYNLAVPNPTDNPTRIKVRRMEMGIRSHPTYTRTEENDDRGAREAPNEERGEFQGQGNRLGAVEPAIEAVGPAMEAGVQAFWLITEAVVTVIGFILWAVIYVINTSLAWYLPRPN